MGSMLGLYSTPLLGISYDTEELGQSLGAGDCYSTIMYRFYKISPEYITRTTRHTSGIVSMPPWMVIITVVEPAIS